MTAQAAGRALSRESLSYVRLTLTSGQVAYKGAIAAFNATGGLIAGATALNLVPIGTFAEDVDASAAAAPVNVRLAKDVDVIWFKNDGTVTAADIGDTAYIVDDQTVANTNGTGTRSALGRIWKIETTRGVAVQIAL